MTLMATENEANKGENEEMAGITIVEPLDHGKGDLTAQDKEELFRELGVERSTLKQPAAPQPPRGKDLQDEFRNAGEIEVEEGGPLDEVDL